MKNTYITRTASKPAPGSMIPAAERFTLIRDGAEMGHWEIRVVEASREIGAAPDYNSHRVAKGDTARLDYATVTAGGLTPELLAKLAALAGFEGDITAHPDGVAASLRSVARSDAKVFYWSKDQEREAKAHKVAFEKALAKELAQ
jgi:hypothetical protein